MMRPCCPTPPRLHPPVSRQCPIATCLVAGRLVVGYCLIVTKTSVSTNQTSSNVAAAYVLGKQYCHLMATEDPKHHIV